MYVCLSVTGLKLMKYTVLMCTFLAHAAHNAITMVKD